MYRRVIKSNPRQSQTQRPATGLVYGRVNGVMPAPAPFIGTVMPTATMDMNMKMNMNMSVSGQSRPSYGYDDMGLDDYRALHYYGLDGFDNIDF